MLGSSGLHGEDFQELIQSCWVGISQLIELEKGSQAGMKRLSRRSEPRVMPGYEWLSVDLLLPYKHNPTPTYVPQMLPQSPASHLRLRHCIQGVLQHQLDLNQSGQRIGQHGDGEQARVLCKRERPQFRPLYPHVPGTPVLGGWRQEKALGLGSARWLNW